MERPSARNSPGTVSLFPVTFREGKKESGPAFVRRPAVAGYFYPAEPEGLREAIDALAQRKGPVSQAHAVIVPHGSLRWSGPIAAAALSQVAIPRRCILLGPSHTASRMRWSLMSAGAYRTPLGDVPVDELYAQALRQRCPFLEADAWAQRGEHALEVIIPFLQRLGPSDLTIVPIVTESEDEAELARMAQALAQTARMSEERCLFLASADLSHDEPAGRAAEQDGALIERISALDGAGLVRAVRDGAARMCGAGAVACVLEAAKALGAHRGRLVRYGTSADAGGDPHSATGYAGIVID